MPCCVSLALPLKPTVEPTCQVVLEAGAEIVAFGAVLPALIVTWSVSLAPTWSVTRSLTTWVPAG